MDESPSSLSDSIEHEKEVTINTPSSASSSLCKDGIDDTEIHPLRIRIQSPMFRSMSNKQIVTHLKTRFGDFTFVLDRIQRRSSGFLQFKDSLDAYKFFNLSQSLQQDIEGSKDFINIRRYTLHRTQDCDNVDLKETTFKEEEDHKKTKHYLPIVGFVPSPLVPCLIDFKQQRRREATYFKPIIISEKVTPLARFSYATQLRLKHQFLQTCIKNLRKGVYLSEYGPTSCSSLSPPSAKRARLTVNPIISEEGTSQNQRNNQKLLWCHRNKATSHKCYGCEVEEMIPSPICVGYRNKCEFTIGYTSDHPTLRKPEVGFVSHVVNYEPIVVQPYGLIHISDSMKELAFKLNHLVLKYQRDLPVYSRREQSGAWRLAMVRESDEGLLVVVQINSLTSISSSTNKSVNELELLIHRILVEELVNDTSMNTSHGFRGKNIIGLFLEERKEVSDAFGTDFKRIYGKDHLLYSLLGLQFRVQPTAFFQTNISACEVLYQNAFEFLAPSSEKVIFDICSGTGTIALCLKQYILTHQEQQQQHTPHIIGVEIIQEAVADAIVNAQNNKIHLTENYKEGGVQFIAGKAEDIVPNLLKLLEPKDIASAIVDPPRAGLHSTLIKSLLTCVNIDRIVYISCNPTSMIQDALQLCLPCQECQYPFKPTRCIGVDMFPHTYHCETVLLLERTTSQDFGIYEPSS